MNDSLPHGVFGPLNFKAIFPGLRLFNQRKFWECHEELESVWLEDRSDNARLIYWAVIQAANALHHYTDGNSVGAAGQLGKAKEKIRKAKELGVETPFLYKAFNWQEFSDKIMSLNVESVSDWDGLLAFKFRPWAPYVKEYVLED